MIDKVAVVTGSNKGIGFGIVRELCRRGVRSVYLTARDEDRGRKAVSVLNAEGLQPKFHLLDVTNVNSIKKCAAHMKKAHGGVDILINNVGMSQRLFANFDYEYNKEILDINYRSVIRVQNEFFPILKQNARVINISSGWGHIYYLRNQYWIKNLCKEDITTDDVNAFVEWFLESVKNKSLTEKDFTNETCNAYKASKIAMCAVTRAHQRLINGDKRNISINSLHPGSVRTDSSTDIGEYSIDEGAIAPVYLALDVDQSLKGQFVWCDKEVIEWSKPADFIYKNGGQVIYMAKGLAKINKIG